MAAKRISKKSKVSKKRASKKKATRRASRRPTKGAPTKADFIRSKLAEGMSPTEIIQSAAAAGITIPRSQVYKVKARVTEKTPASRGVTAASAPRAGKMTASDFIRKHPGKSAGEVVKLGAAQGLKFSASAVYQTRGYDKRKGVASRRRQGRATTHTTASNGDAAFKRMALEIGFPRAREIVVDLERKWNALLA